MIKIPLTKILFLDIETVGGCKNYTECQVSNPNVAKQFEKYFDWFQKRFPEDAGFSADKVFEKRAALVPEFAKIVCVSVAFVMDNGDIKKQSFSGDDERALLKELSNIT
jgi:epoxyqueuosine reductase QueG